MILNYFDKNFVRVQFIAMISGQFCTLLSLSRLDFVNGPGIQVVWAEDETASLKKRC